MRMRVNEAGKDHTISTINFGDTLAVLANPRIVECVLGTADRDDLAPDAEYRRSFNHPEFT